MSDFTENDFKELLKNSTTPVLADFWAEWCGPCKALSPTIQEIEQEYKDKIAVAKINVDYNQGLASEYGIRSIPTLILFKNGQPIETKVGNMTKKQLQEWLSQHA